ncbi:HAD-IA family hydrolase [Sphaerisporangium sp. TRM90804]|uniref:HAD family hydrolase n=1 Tax=Sphaerisporangium sp. TRM90804 TaxID=3031113 RepID=UPI00244C34DB|nr:HAD-IA family hydrolase [Sphaerisporangium sp. TRM90804]MDH2430456.1 HAD-IA family hydrolase [Sphaerisporangium sp. TRM90804]
MTGSHTPVRAVVFDLDGTLVDSMAVVPQVYVDTIRSLGGPLVSPKQVVAAWHAGPTRTVLAHFLGRTVTDDDLARYYERLEAVTATVQVFPGVVEMLRALRREGYPLGVFTAATRRGASRVLATTGLGEYLPVLVGGDETALPKPAPEGLELACRRMGVPVADVAYVGDADVDHRCATAAGAVSIQASWAGSGVTGTPSPLVARHPGEVVELLRRASR